VACSREVLTHSVISSKAGPGRPKGVLNKLAPLSTFRQSLKAVAERAKDGDPEAQNLVVQAALMHPEWAGLEPVTSD
jgi:hypothetical protein